MKTSHRALSILLLLGWVLPTACGPTPEATLPPSNDGARPAPVNVSRSDRPRLEAAPVTDANRAAWAEGNTAFAVDLYHVVSSQDGNLFFSPYSISVALAMTYAGAAGETAAQMADAMRFGLPPGQLHPAFNAYEQELEKRAKESGEGTPFELSIANSLWGQESFEFRPEFLDLLAENYGAGMHLVDFMQDSEGARQAINAWVSDETRGKIEDLIPRGVLDSMTRLVLANAIYFKAGWLHGFNKDLTASEAFHRLDGSTVDVPMMHQTESFGYLRSANYRALQMPYQTGDLSMVILLPDEGDFDSVQAALTPEMLREIAAGVSSTSVDVSLPKFSYDSSFELNAALQALGMTDAFDQERADFSGMDGARDLYIGDVLHKAFVAVDENGTEAAAATAVIMKLTSAMPGEPAVFKADRPFLYLVLDTQTGSVLFLGRVLDPAA